MIRALDFRAFGPAAKARAEAVYEHVTRKYTQLALEAAESGRVGVALRFVAEATRAIEGKGPKRVAATAHPFAHLAEPVQPSPRTQDDAARKETLRQRARLAEVFKLAQARDQVEWTAARLEEGWALKHLRIALTSMPEASHGPRGGLAARIAARDALASAPSVSGTSSEQRVAALKAAYAKATGEQI